jgi:hypothetical protein
MFSSEDLPAPLGPRMAVSSPQRNLPLREFKIWRHPEKQPRHLLNFVFEPNKVRMMFIKAWLTLRRLQQYYLYIVLHVLMCN